MKIKIFLAWYDFWIGVFYDKKKRIIYICLVPCVVIQINRGPLKKEIHPAPRRRYTHGLDGERIDITRHDGS